MNNSVLATIKEATIIDVRNDWEYEEGHVPGAVNIPLHEMQERVDEIRNFRGTIVVCCASGIRSMQAATLLKQHGFLNVQSGGSWLDVNEMLAEGNNKC